MHYFTISEFGKLRNVNINSLRYYEKIGISKPEHVDAETGYRYYSPDQLPILDVILLCLVFGMPLKEMRSYISDDNFINNSQLFEIGKQMAKERLHQAQIELNKIEYTQRYMQSNQRYSETVGLYRRNIPERTIVTMDYHGNLADVRRIETSSAQDPHTMVLSEGTFLCSKLDMTPGMDLPATIENIYGTYQQVVVANILLDRFQIGTKRSEVQMRIL